MEEQKQSEIQYPDLPTATAKKFDESWVFPSILKEQLQASSWRVLRTGDRYKSGRPIEEVTFMNVAPSKGGDHIGQVKRRGMTLVSKKGISYVVAEAL